MRIPLPTVECPFPHSRRTTTSYTTLTCLLALLSLTPGVSFKSPFVLANAPPRSFSPLAPASGVSWCAWPLSFRLNKLVREFASHSLAHFYPLLGSHWPRDWLYRPLTRSWFYFTSSCTCANQDLDGVLGLGQAQNQSSPSEHAWPIEYSCQLTRSVGKDARAAGMRDCKSRADRWRQQIKASRLANGHSVL